MTWAGLRSRRKLCRVAPYSGALFVCLWIAGCASSFQNRPMPTSVLSSMEPVDVVLDVDDHIGVFVILNDDQIDELSGMSKSESLGCAGEAYGMFDKANSDSEQKMQEVLGDSLNTLVAMRKDQAMREQVEKSFVNRTVLRGNVVLDRDLADGNLLDLQRNHGRSTLVMHSRVMLSSAMDMITFDTHYELYTKPDSKGDVKLVKSGNVSSAGFPAAEYPGMERADAMKTYLDNCPQKMPEIWNGYMDLLLLDLTADRRQENHSRACSLYGMRGFPLRYMNGLVYMRMDYGDLMGFEVPEIVNMKVSRVCVLQNGGDDHGVAGMIVDGFKSRGVEATVVQGMDQVKDADALVTYDAPITAMMFRGSYVRIFSLSIFTADHKRLIGWVRYDKSSVKVEKMPEVIQGALAEAFCDPVRDLLPSPSAKGTR
jgi:hypothetical protein